MDSRRIVVEEEYVTYDVPWEDDEAGHARFGAWIDSACGHQRMEYASEYLANWPDFRLFQQQLEHFGLHLFPTLAAELPEINGGAMPADRAPAALLELERFDTLCRHSQATRTVLVAADSESEIFEYIESYGGVFIHSGSERLEVGIDSTGFFVRRKNGEEIIRGMEVTQTVISGDGQYGATVQYRDPGGRTLACRSGVTIDHEVTDGRITGCRYPPLLRVEDRELDPTRFSYIVESLGRLCRASIATGNPVAWC